MGRPTSVWTADRITFLFICLRLGVPLKDLAKYFNTTVANVHEAAKRNGMKANDLRMSPEEIKQFWDNGALRFLF